MAEKRMYSKKITETDDFLALPLSTQALYFHLGMNADDDGFVSSPMKVMRMIGANRNELDILLAKSYLIPFASGVCVIKHWRINNYLRRDRYTPSIYDNEKKELVQLENGSYELKTKIGIPMVDQMETQNSIDKISIEEINNISDENDEEIKLDNETPNKIDISSTFDILYKLYPCSINKNKKTSLNLYYSWLIGKHISIMGSKKLIRYNHIQIMFALKKFIDANNGKQEEFIPRLPTFLGEKTLCDWVEESRNDYVGFMTEKYGEDWTKVKFDYVKGE